MTGSEILAGVLLVILVPMLYQLINLSIQQKRRFRSIMLELGAIKQMLSGKTD